MNGNYSFFAPAGTSYVISISGVGLTTYSYVWTAPVVSGGGTAINATNLIGPGSITGTISGNYTGSGNRTDTGTNTHSGTETFANIDAIQLVDGVTNTTVQVAINKLPVGGGTVYVPCGTYAGPTTFPQHTRIISLCPHLTAAQAALIFTAPAYGTVNATIFQYSSGLTIASAGNLEFRGIVFDFQSNGANLILNTITNGDFDMSVVNCGTTNPCLTLGVTGPGPGTANVGSKFWWLWLQGGSTGLKFQGNTANAVVTESHFFDLWIVEPTTIGIDFNQRVDSVIFDRTYIAYNTNNFQGVVMNSGGGAVDTGVATNVFKYIDFTVEGAPTGGNAFVLNTSYGNVFHTGEITGSIGTTPFLLNQPATTTYAWIHAGGATPSDEPSLTSSGLTLNSLLAAQPSIKLKYQGTLKWNIYNNATAGDQFMVNDGTNNIVNIARGAPASSLAVDSTGKIVSPTLASPSINSVSIPSPNYPSQVIYNTASASTSASIAATTMVTVGGSAASYRFGAYLDQTVVGVGCTGNTTVIINLIWTDPNGAGATTLALSTFTITTNGALGNSLVVNPASIRAKATTAVQYSTTYTLGAGCTTSPSYQVFPTLEAM